MLSDSAQFAGLADLLSDLSSDANSDLSVSLGIDAPPSQTDTFEFDWLASLTHLQSDDVADEGPGDDEEPEDDQDDGQADDDEDIDPQPDDDDDGAPASDGTQTGGSGDLPFLTIDFTQLGDDTLDPDDQTFDILVQRHEPNGDPIGDPIKVNPTPALGASDAEAITLSDGGFVVAWRSDDPASGEPQLFFRIFSENGDPVTDALPFGEELPAGDGVLDLTDASHGFTLEWLPEGQDGVPLETGIAKDFSEDGTPFLLPDFADEDDGGSGAQIQFGADEHVRFGDQDYSDRSWRTWVHTDWGIDIV